MRALLLSLCLLVPSSALAAQAEGYLDSATSSIIGGWARDPDNTGPIAVHIYIDGEIAHAMGVAAVAVSIARPEVRAVRAPLRLTGPLPDGFVGHDDGTTTASTDL